MIKLRMTQLNDYERCPYLCKVNWGAVGELGKVDLEGSSTNKYAQYGIIFHEVMEISGLAKMEGVVIPLESLHEELDKKLLEFDLSLVESEEEHLEWSKSLHEQLDWAYHNCSLETDNVIGVEHSFLLDDLIEDCLPFSGTIDRIIGNLEKKEVALCDFKTGKVYTKKELSNNIQATVYSLAFYKMFGFMPEEFRFYFTKHKKVKVIKITPDFIKRGVERILVNWYNINNGDFSPNTSNKYFCKNFCSINKECPTRKRVTTIGWENVG